jgi:hypothetical protein
MKANELRIGNWVRIKDVPTTNEWQVESIGNLQQVGGQLWSIEELEPIPLTEEWLEQFGFEKVVNGLFAIDLFHYNLKEYRLYISKNESNEVDFVEIKHVHSLQNLYFALTGEELNQNKEDESSN